MVLVIDSILGPFLFLVYVNYLSKGLNARIKFFRDDTSFFPIVCDPRVTTGTLNEDLKHTNGKCCLILILQNKPNKLYFLERTNSPQK